MPRGDSLSNDALSMTNSHYELDAEKYVVSTNNSRIMIYICISKSYSLGERPIPAARARGKLFDPRWHN